MNTSSENQSDTDQAHEVSDGPVRPPLSRRWRIIISVFLAGHLTAVFLPPFMFASAGPDIASPLAAPMMRWFGPYIDMMFLNHGYFFFAPNPGPSHLVRYDLEWDDSAGRPRSEKSLTMPDLDRHWPRLLYHRHFMLSETLNNVYAPGQVAPEVLQDQAAAASWRQQRDLYESMRTAFENKVQHDTGAVSVKATRVEHRQPTPPEYLEGRMSIRDQRLIVDMAD